MKTIKSITLGILIGAVTTLSITTLAEYIVNPNTYPVLVDGQEVDIEGYNINDSTYFKLRDIGNKTGFSVDFANNTIIINSTASTPEPVSTPTPAPVNTSNVIKPTLDPNKKYKPYEEYFEYKREDGLPVYNFDGRYYVNTADICVKTDFDTHKFDDNYMLSFNSYVRFVLIDYYDNTVLANPDNFKNG